MAADQAGVLESGDVARAGAGEAPSRGNEETVYQLKWLPWRGDFTPVVTQSANGPCPLLALCNVLLLRGNMKIAPGTTAITSNELLNHLATVMFEQLPQGMSEGERSNSQQNIHDAMRVFPQLQTGLDVNVKFDKVNSFEFTSELAVFDLCGVRLYHGWLADPQDVELYGIVAPLSYNQLVEKSIANSMDPVGLLCREFLMSSANQLTCHGLCELTAAIAENELCVFFRNNHFSTMYKHQGRLLLLVTDFGFLNEFGHVWETMDDVSGDANFLNAMFLPQQGVTSEALLAHDMEVAKYTNDPLMIEDTGTSGNGVDKTTNIMSDQEIARQLQQEEFDRQQALLLEEEEQQRQLNQPLPRESQEAETTNRTPQEANRAPPPPQQKSPCVLL